MSLNRTNVDDNTGKATPPPPAVTNRAEHRAYLDGVRGAAALFVIGHHLCLQARLPFTLYGHFAVDLFIVLSGFCLALPVAANGGTISGGTLRYFIRRALRILPPYYLCLALSLWLVRFWHLEKVSSQELMTHLFLIHDAFLGPDLAINSPLWTIAVEWRIYLVFPLLAALTRYWGAGPTAIVCLLTSELIYGLLQGTPVNTGLHGVSTQYLTLFATGMLGAGIVQGREQRLAKGRAAWLWWPLVIGLTWMMVAGGKAAQSEARIWDYRVGLWAASVLVLASIPVGKWLRCLLSFPPLAWCGVMGYSLYLVHMPLVRGLDQTLRHMGITPAGMDPMTRFGWLAGIGFPAIVIFSIVFYLICELPFRQWSQRVRRSPRAPEIAELSEVPLAQRPPHIAPGLLVDTQRS